MSGTSGSFGRMRRRLSKAIKSMSHPVTRAALREKVAPTFEHEHLLRGLGPINTVIDVGANNGQFALLCRLVHPNARVISFEPMAAAAARFEKIFAQDDHVTLHRTALGTEEGETVIHLSARDDSSSLMPQAEQSDYFPQTGEVGTETIKIAPLASCVRPSDLSGPVLMKIDVQGFEGEVLKGSADLLVHVDWIYCEASFKELYQGQPLAGEIIAYLAGHGFEIASVTVDESMVFDGRAIQADFLFYKPKAAG
ncbi:MAG: FkbM family methyltransferase [Pseudomonadota bacterium]